MYTSSIAHRVSGAALLAAVLIAGAGQHAPSARADQPTRATGGGFYTGVYGHTLVTVSAIQQPDGRVNGHLEQQFSDLGLAVHGTVDCVCITSEALGKGAVISGTVTDIQKTNDAAAQQVSVHEGDRFVVKVVDNGEGKNAPAPDQVSLTVFGPANSCGSFPTLPLISIDGGNYQVVGTPTCPPPSDIGVS
jgi:hypothetical protein